MYNYLDIISKYKCKKNFKNFKGELLNIFKIFFFVIGFNLKIEFWVYSLEVSLDWVGGD